MHFRDRTFIGNPKYWCRRIRRDWRKGKRNKYYSKLAVTQEKKSKREIEKIEYRNRVKRQSK